MLHLFLDPDRLSDAQAVYLLVTDFLLTPLLLVFGFAWAVRPQSSSEGL